MGNFLAQSLARLAHLSRSAGLSKIDSGTSPILYILISYILPIALMVLVFHFFSKKMAQRMGSQAAPILPTAHALIGARQLRDWLSLLGFEIDEGCFGCYRPALARAPWFQRLQWLEAAGDRWWPYLGGVYFLVATKRVRSLRPLHPRWQLAQQTGSAAPAIRRDS